MTTDTTTKMIRHDISADDIEIDGVNENEVGYTNSIFGTFNVTRALVWAREHCKIIKVRMTLTDTAEMLQRQDLDPEQLRRLALLSDAELIAKGPLFHVAVIHEGVPGHILIDGNHRLFEMARRCLLHDCTAIECDSYEATLEQMQPFRIKYYARLPDGSRIELAGDVVLAIISGVYTDADGTLRDNRDGTMRVVGNVDEIRDDMRTRKS